VKWLVFYRRGDARSSKKLNISYTVDIMRRNRRARWGGGGAAQIKNTAICRIFCMWLELTLNILSGIKYPYE
jgi:hypothetical protein